MSVSDLYKEFESVNREEWLAKIIADQKGTSIDKLSWQFEGIEVSPFHHAEEMPERIGKIIPNATDNTWQIGEYFDATDPIVANAAMLESLELGVSAIYVSLRETAQDYIDKVFSEIQHEWIITHIDLRECQKPHDLIKSVITVVRDKGQDPTKIKGSIRLNIDAESGWLVVKEVFHSLPAFKIVLNSSCDGTRETKDDLLNILTNTYDFFQQGQEENVELPVLMGKLQYLVHVGDDFYRNIVMLRSIRILVNTLCNSYEVGQCESVSIESWLKYSNQLDDSNYNLIKNTSQILSSVIGGADYIYAACYNNVDVDSDELRRIKRNISHVLQLESYMDRVVDPVGGSYFFESLTDQVCKAVWDEFQNRVEA